MKNKLEAEFKKLKKNFIVLTMMPQENFSELNLHLMKLLTKKSPSGAYISVNKPYDKMIEIFKKAKIAHEKLFFIDCMGEKQKNIENCTFIESPESLTNIAIALDAVYKNEEHAFIFLDSLDTLGVYHKPEMLIRFVRSLVQKTRENNKIGLMVGVHEGMNKQVLDEIAVICDKVIHLGK